MLTHEKPQVSREEQLQQERLEAIQPGLARFDEHLEQAGQFPLQATGIEILQLNVGRVCNQTCRHCHVSAGPRRRESMAGEIFELALDVLRTQRIPVVDITGGAPELNPHFRGFVTGARALGCTVIDRCNLTVTQEAGQQDLVDFLHHHEVQVVASLPAPTQAETDAQRGEAVFERSILALRQFNAAGYGTGDPRWPLHLVTNPTGAFLPGDQTELERHWKQQLLEQQGVRFDSLFTMANMPIGRFLHWLDGKGQLVPYLRRLQAAWNPRAASSVMCRNTLSVDWRGFLYDCDFNQMLGLCVDHGAPVHLRDFRPDLHHRRRIVTGLHCYGCTAGGGSSCGGALDSPEA
ncbi:MAG: arsenosugar biosynthesis radical SAM protein ArsS [Candidatus Delongbacteria bacterium]|nr:arsenosugar biosynthesis radical SAM protein ArsS [Candidatus Delongbacteria bacterium]